MIPGVTLIKNAEKVSQRWEQFCDDPRLTLIEVRHAEKADNTPRGGLSGRGEEQAAQMRLAIGSALKRLNAKRGCYFLSSDTKRCLRTMWHLVAALQCMDPEMYIGTPKELDIPFLGPNDEDAKTCTQVAKKLSVPRNDAFALNWEKHGFQRIGEPRAASLARIHNGLKKACDSHLREVVIYCGNSPLMDAALGIPGVMAELEALFFTYESGQFKLLGRVAPEFLG